MDQSNYSANETQIRGLEIGEEVADIFHPIFMKTAEQILELGLQQMRKENESLTSENRRLKDEARTLIEQIRLAGFANATKGAEATTTVNYAFGSAIESVTNTPHTTKGNSI